MATWLRTFVLVSVAVFCVNADTPANCTYEDIRGEWTFYEGERAGDSSIDCAHFYPEKATRVFKLEFAFPNLVVDQYGNTGYWTIIYNQGFEAVINYRKFFAFSNYTEQGKQVTSYCGQTLPGWSHNVLTRNWACYIAQKTTKVPPKQYIKPRPRLNDVHEPHIEFIQRINMAQNSWTATIYPQDIGITMDEIIKRSGGLKSKIHSPPKPTPVLPEHLAMTSGLPDHFDWRDVDGINYVSPVRNQKSCGSCFAFASTGLLEARLRIATNNSDQTIFSTQDIVSCSEYAQGCDGGFPYLIAGKYAEDFGLVPEKCFPYIGQDTKCIEKKCKRYYATNYKYIGGFYGGCNEELMKLELVKNGPIAVAFEVYADLKNYRGGVYHHTNLSNLKVGFDPFLITNHAVLAIGYGTDAKTGENYWIVKNSWGDTWGEKGYFRIRRGTNECSIESIAVASTPIP